MTIVSNATLPSQKVLETTLGAVDAFLERDAPPTPAIVVVGQLGEWRASSTGTRRRCGRTRLADGLVIAAPASGTGKTIVTLGLLRALRNRGHRRSLRPRPAPTISIRASTKQRPGVPASISIPGRCARAPWSRYLTSRQGRRSHPHRRRHGPVRRPGGGRGSTADLADDFDCRWSWSSTQRAGAVGRRSGSWLCHDCSARIALAGVILNRVASDRHERILRSALLARRIVLGSGPPRRRTRAALRHLGLVQASENRRSRGFHRHAPHASPTARSISMACRARPAAAAAIAESGVACRRSASSIAVARDEAFAFSYPHMLARLARAGRRARASSRRSPTRRRRPMPMPSFCPAAIPSFMPASSPRTRTFMPGCAMPRRSGALIYGECGGFMVLGDYLDRRRGNARMRMAGLLPLTHQLRRAQLHLGYRRLEHEGALPLADRLRGSRIPLFDARPSGRRRALFAASRRSRCAICGRIGPAARQGHGLLRPCHR